MKITPIQMCGRRWPARFTLAGCALGALLFAHSLAAAVYDVQLTPSKFTVYRDPNTGNELQLGGFSGLYPVPGSSKCVYTITDRGPNGDNPTNASGKVFPRPDYSPSIVELKLQ